MIVVVHGAVHDHDHLNDNVNINGRRAIVGRFTTYTYAVGTATTIRCDEGAERVELVRVTARGCSPARDSSETEDHFLRAMFESHSRSLP